MYNGNQFDFETGTKNTRTSRNSLFFILNIKTCLTRSFINVLTNNTHGIIPNMLLYIFLETFPRLLCRPVSTYWSWTVHHKCDNSTRFVPGENAYQICTHLDTEGLQSETDQKRSITVMGLSGSRQAPDSPLVCLKKKTWPSWTGTLSDIVSYTYNRYKLWI